MAKRIKKKKATSTGCGSIKATVAEIPDIDETKRYSIGFRYFDDSLCVLREVNAKVARKIHEVYRNIGDRSTVNDVRELPHDIKPIHNSGHYTKYFKRVTEDTDVHEFDAGECRGFLFLMK